MTLKLLIALVLTLIASPALAQQVLGDFPVSALIDFKWNTNSQTGASITRSTDGTLRVYKANSATERSSLAGITQTEDFDTTTGIHHVRIDTSDNTDAGFYAAGGEYQVCMASMVVDTITVSNCIASFSIERANGVLALLKSVISGSSQIRADIRTILGTAAATPATAGILEVNVKNINNVATTSVTTINANQGTTQPVNFTGTGASALAKADTINIAGTAQSAGGDVGLSSARFLGMIELDGAVYRFTTNALELAPSGSGSCAGTTLLTGTVWKKDTTSKIQNVFIADSTTCQGKTGLTSASSGLTIAYSRVDQGNGDAQTCTVASATRGSYTSCGFVEKDPTLLPGWYEVGWTTAMLAAGADEVVIGVGGVSGTVPTVVPIALTTNTADSVAGLIGTPAGASLAADTAAVKAVVDAIKPKTDPIQTAGGLVLTRVDGYNTGQAPLQPAVAGRTLNVEATGQAGINWGDVANKTTTNALTGTTVSSSQNVATATTATTCTNLTNAPTAGDLTATMKSSVTTACTAATPTAAGVTGGNFPANTPLVSAAGAMLAATYRKNVASQPGFYVYFRASATPTSTITGLTNTWTMQLTCDGAALGAGGGTKSEVGGGLYFYVPSQGDTNCNSGAFLATGTGAIPYVQPMQTTR